MEDLFCRTQLISAITIIRLHYNTSRMIRLLRAQPQLITEGFFADESCLRVLLVVPLGGLKWNQSKQNYTIL